MKHLYAAARTRQAEGQNSNTRQDKYSNFEQFVLKSKDKWEHGKR